MCSILTVPLWLINLSWRCRKSFVTTFCQFAQHSWNVSAITSNLLSRSHHFVSLLDYHSASNTFCITFKPGEIKKYSLKVKQCLHCVTWNTNIKPAMIGLFLKTGGSKTWWKSQHLHNVTLWSCGKEVSKHQYVSPQKVPLFFETSSSCHIIVSHLNFWPHCPTQLPLSVSVLWTEGCIHIHMWMSMNEPLNYQTD